MVCRSSSESLRLDFGPFDGLQVFFHRAKMKKNLIQVSVLHAKILRDYLIFF